MHLSPPRRIVFAISVALAITGLVSALGVAEPLVPYAFWLVFVAWLLIMVDGLGGNS